MTHVSTINIHPESGEDILIERRLYDGSHWVSISVGDVNIAIFGKPAINVRESDNVRLVCAEPQIGRAHV